LIKHLNSMKKIIFLFIILSVEFISAGTRFNSGEVPDTFTVLFQTTKGDFVAEFYRDWSPLGVERFYKLVNEGYYDSLAIFRVVKNFVAQFGISNDYETNLKWDKLPIKDEPVMASNERGVIAFARSGVDTRSTQIFINIKDNTRLDTVTYGGVTGFPPLGRIIKGIEVIDKLNSEYGEAPDQDSITVKGKEYTQRKFSDMDYILKAQMI
jgi:peptidyl-prolyl cis-trans isomerase A (cyclophilin A)